MTIAPPIPEVDVEELRCEIRKEYADVAENPDKGFHFHTGRRLAAILGYDDSLLEGIPEAAIESLAGTGNPFSLGEIGAGSNVVDIGAGSGLDSLIAGRLVGPSGSVIGVDMTGEMLAKARTAAAEAGFDHVEFKKGYAEMLPVDDGWADVVISNGVVNLCGSKSATSLSRRRCPKAPSETSISGRAESPALCWKQSSNRWWSRPDSRISS
jgi:SAM-dependent methyltransferase